MARIMRESGSLSNLPTRSNHNQVDIERIQAGIDVRTTVRSMISRHPLLTAQQIMLRNIPNKVDQATLKALLDQTSFGAYDFMYLRIGTLSPLNRSAVHSNTVTDFANNCKCVADLDCRYSRTDLDSVGYAFINFVDVRHLMTLPSFSLTLSSLCQSSHLPAVAPASVGESNCNSPAASADMATGTSFHLTKLPKSLTQPFKAATVWSRSSATPASCLSIHHTDQK